MRRHLYIFSLFVILNTYFYAAVVLIFIFQAFFIRRLRNMQDIRYFSFISNLKRIFCIYNNIVLFFGKCLMKQLPGCHLRRNFRHIHTTHVRRLHPERKSNACVPIAADTHTKYLSPSHAFPSLQHKSKRCERWLCAKHKLRAYGHISLPSTLTFRHLSVSRAPFGGACVSCGTKQRFGAPATQPRRPFPAESVRL